MYVYVQQAMIELSEGMTQETQHIIYADVSYNIDFTPLTNQLGYQL